MNPDDEVFVDWLASAPKGVRWDLAQEMWEEYLRKRREEASAAARKLLGKKETKSLPDWWDSFGD